MCDNSNFGYVRLVRYPAPRHGRSAGHTLLTQTISTTQAHFHGVFLGRLHTSFRGQRGPNRVMSQLVCDVTVIAQGRVHFRPNPSLPSKGP